MIRNKHLIKIINEYINYKLKYLHELENNTSIIWRNFNTFRYYSTYRIVYDDTDYYNNFPIEYKDEHKYKIRKNINGEWAIYLIEDLRQLLGL